MVALKALMALLLALVILPASVYGAHGLVTSSSRTEVNAGQRATFAINVTDTSGDNVTRIVTDFNGFLFAGATCPSGFSQSNTASVLTCSAGLLQNLTSAFVNIDLTAPASAGAYYFTTTTTDNNGGTSSSVIGISVKTPAALSVTPSFASKKVSAGSTFALSATLNNAGQTNVTSPSITMVLPSGYTLGQDETKLTKTVDIGSSVSWNIMAPSSGDTIDRTITITPSGNDFNTGAPATATAASVTVRATAMSITAVVDKTSALAGEGVRVSGYVKEGDTQLKTAYVVLQTSFGSRQTTYTDSSGHYSFMVFMPQASGEYSLDVSATHGDLTGSATASVIVGELLVNAAVSPTSVNKGGSATVKGKVSESGAPIGGAEIRIRVGSAKTYLTVSDSFGAFSQAVVATAVGSNRLEVVATTNDGKTGTAILLLNAAGKANRTIEMTAPPAVNPSQNFTVSGRLLSDGEGANGTVEVAFADVSRLSPDVSGNGEFSVSLTAPQKEGCYYLTAKSPDAETITRKICAYSHSDIKIAISARTAEPGPNVITITALYEDGMPVTGSLTYGIDATQYVSNISAGAKLVDVTFPKSGKYFVSAYVDDSVRQKMFSKNIAIGNVTAATATPTGTAAPAAITTTPTQTPAVTATGNAPATSSPEAVTRTNLALLLVGGIIILLLFF